MHSGIRKMYQKFCTKYKDCIKKGIDNGNKQSEYTIISSRNDSIYAPWGGGNNENFLRRNIMTNEKPILSKMDKVAKILNNKLNFNFASTKQNFEISFDEIPAESIAIILDYGTRKLNDKVNSLFANEKNTATREQLIARVLGELKEGSLGERKATTGGNTAFRDFIFSILRGAGRTAKELKAYHSLAPEKIVAEIWKDASAEKQAEILAELKRRFDEAQRLQRGFEIKL